MSPTDKALQIVQKMAEKARSKKAEAASSMPIDENGGDPGNPGVGMSPYEPSGRVQEAAWTNSSDSPLPHSGNGARCSGRA